MPSFYDDRTRGIKSTTTNRNEPFRWLVIASRQPCQALTAASAAVEPPIWTQSTPAVISVKALSSVAMSASVLNGPGLTRKVPSGNVPIALWA